MFEVVTEVFVADAFELFASDAGVDESLDFYRAEELIGDFVITYTLLIIYLQCWHSVLNSTWLYFSVTRTLLRNAGKFVCE